MCNNETFFQIKCTFTESDEGGTNTKVVILDYCWKQKYKVNQSALYLKQHYQYRSGLYGYDEKKLTDDEAKEQEWYSNDPKSIFLVNDYGYVFKIECPWFEYNTWLVEIEVIIKNDLFKFTT